MLFDPKTKLEGLVGKFDQMIADLESAIAEVRAKQNSNDDKIAKLKKKNWEYEASVDKAQKLKNGINKLME